MHRIIITGKNADLGARPFQEVARAEFYTKMGPLNVHPQFVSDQYPYSTEWRMQDGSRALIGKIEGSMEGSLPKFSYFLTDAGSR